MEEKKCKDCGETKPIVHFRKHSKNSKYLRSYCNVCHNKRAADTKIKRWTKNPQKKAETVARQLSRRALERVLQHEDLSIRAKIICEDSRSSDRKNGNDNDLSQKWVLKEISSGCSYCGSTGFMTLDRIENDIGHTTNNVVPACERCNLLRRDMPYEIWMRFVPLLKELEEENAFGDWTGSIHR